MNDEVIGRLRAIVETMDDAVVTTDLDGVITSWNPAAERLFGYPSTDVLGRSLLVILPDGAGEERDILTRLRRGESIRDLDAVRRRQDGTVVPISLTASLIHGPDDTPAGAVHIARSLSGRQQAGRAGRRLAAIVESSDDAIISKDLNGIVTSWNRAAELMFGYRAAEMIGRPIRDLIPQDRQPEEDHVLACIRRGDKVDHFETIRQRKNGSLVAISLTVSPILDDDGTVVGASKIARDISERKRLEAERARLLAEAEEHAATTEKLNEVGTVVASAFDRDAVVRAVTDAATELTLAQVGAYFYNALDERGEPYALGAVSGMARETGATFPMLRSTEILEPTFRAARVVRSDDILDGTRDGGRATYESLPPGQLPIRSYLAVPVKAKSGEVLGGLVFGHSETGRFTARHERLAVGIASWASIALENAALYIGVQEASRLKDEFLATLSHELRTPLNAILGYARMIRSGIVPPEKQRKAVETIERNATSLTQIVEDVLDVSRIISGKLRLNVQPVDLPDVVRHSIEGVIPAADAKGVSIDVVLDPLAAPIFGDPERLQQVVWNLMTNAVKFTNRGGRVHVQLCRVNAHIEFTVSDTGIGIPPAFLPHVFERFRQASAGTTRERGGLGLGLAIARQLVEMHGGTISAKSPGEGKGSTFSIRFPVMIVKPETPIDSHPHKQSHDPERIAVPDLRGVRVLAVDDDQDALNMVREILEAGGADVAVALSARQALDTLRTLRPDVLVSDLGMPSMDGFELIAEVRNSAEPAVREVPAAALTAFARSEDRAKALRSGYQIHLSKPIDPAELMAAIAALAKRTDAKTVG
jgi:PAS domain S-box-containing protein